MSSVGTVTGVSGFADLNQDGYLDVVLGSNDQGNFAFLLNDRTGTMQLEHSQLRGNPNAGFQTAGLPGIFFLGEDRNRPMLSVFRDDRRIGARGPQ